MKGTPLYKHKNFWVRIFDWRILLLGIGGAIIIRTVIFPILFG